MNSPIPIDKPLPAFKIDLDFDLPTIPLMMTRIIQALDDEMATAQKIEELIHHDPSLSARILRLANSPLYAFRSEVKTISHAVTLLGLNLVKSMAIGVSIFDSFRRGAQIEAKHLNDLWVHSYSVGVFSQEIWKRRGSRKEAEFAFLCGLLHDVGKAVYFKKAPAHYSHVFGQERHEDDPDITMAEQEHYGISHAPLGAILVERWGLPPALCEVIRCHHSAVDSSAPIVAAVSLADSIARLQNLGSDGDRSHNQDTSGCQAVLRMGAEEFQQLRSLAESKRAEIESFFRFTR
jgi:HD-like signal output (HDOD) protein